MSQISNSGPSFYFMSKKAVHIISLQKLAIPSALIKSEPTFVGFEGILVATSLI